MLKEKSGETSEALLAISLVSLNNNSKRGMSKVKFNKPKITPKMDNPKKGIAKLLSGFAKESSLK